MGPRSVCFGVRSRKLSYVGQSLDGFPRGGFPFSLRVIHKEGLRPSSGDINRLMMMMRQQEATLFVCYKSLCDLVC
jgi:hypothetical protein